MINIQTGPAFMSELKSSIWGLYEDSLANPQIVSGKKAEKTACGKKAEKTAFCYGFIRSTLNVSDVVIEVFEAIEKQKAEKTGSLTVTVPQAEFILYQIQCDTDKWVEWARDDIRVGHLVKSAYRLRNFLVSELRNKR